MSKKLQPELKPSLHKLLPSYGRRRGRRLRPGRKELMGTLLPELMVTIPAQGIIDIKNIFSSPSPLVGEGGERALTKHSSLKISPLPNPPPQGAREYKEYWLEIGFGGGEHLTHQAALHPEVGIIGCEPYINGVATLLAHIKEHRLSNISIHDDDTRLVTERLPDASLSRVFILYPDPWPKARHHKRRLVSTPFLNELARLMKPGAELRLATDDADYLTWMLEHTLSHPAFRWTAKSCDDWLVPWSDWISTRYEQKALTAGRRPTYLTFLRKQES
jgi:tRNA (guanine-N7-)-methyltransferase